MDKQTELKVLLCDKFLLIENLQSKANQVNSEIRQIKQLIAQEQSKPEKPKVEPEVKMGEDKSKSK